MVRNTVEYVNNLVELKRDLQEYYIKPSELRNLNRKILERRKAPNEPFRAFVTDLCTLMRRHGGYSLEKKIDMMHYNNKAEYRLYLKRRELPTINDFIQRSEELDNTQREMALNLDETQQQVANTRNSQ